MIYEYRCDTCSVSFDVIKPMADFDRPEQCEKCGGVAARHFAPRAVYFIGTGVDHPEFNPGLGCVVKNKAHKRDILKARNLEEIGNESPEKIHKHYDQRREEKLEKAYDDANRGWVGNGDVGT